MDINLKDMASVNRYKLDKYGLHQWVIVIDKYSPHQWVIIVDKMSLSTG